MGILENFKIDLQGLKDEVSDFNFMLSDDFFNTIGTTDVKGGSLDAHLRVKKTAGEYSLEFHVEGTVNVACDICLDDMTIPVVTSSNMVARMGEVYDEDDEVVTVPADEGIVDVAWIIYELIVLAIPTRHVHQEGECNPEMTAQLGQLKVEDAGADDHDVDPRWSELEKLKSLIKE